MKKIIALIMAVLMLGAAFTACTTTPTEPADKPTAEVTESETPEQTEAQEPTVEPKEMTKITLSEVTHSVFYAGQYAAMELGYFEEEGIELELINGGGADNVMTSVLTGQAEIGLAGPEACIYVHKEGSGDAPVVFAQLTNCDGAFIVGREDIDFEWADLAGTTIIGGRKGGVPEMTLEYVMRQNGVIPQEDATVDTATEFSMMAGAFTGGFGDYVALFEPTATEVELAGGGYVLASIGEEGGEMPYTTYFAAPSYMQENEDIIQGFTNAVAKGQQWISQHSSDEIAELIVGYFPDTDLEVLASVAERYNSIGAWKADPIMKEEAFLRLEEVMKTAGELDEGVPFDQYTDNTWAEIAVSNLG